MLIVFFYVGLFEILDYMIEAFEFGCYCVCQAESDAEEKDRQLNDLLVRMAQYEQVKIIAAFRLCLQQLLWYAAFASKPKVIHCTMGQFCSLVGQYTCVRKNQSYGHPAVQT